MSNRYDIAKQAQQALRDEVERTSKALKNYPTGPMGLVPDSVRQSPEFKRDKQAYDAAFNRLREYNGWFIKQFKKQIQAERGTKRGRA